MIPSISHLIERIDSGDIKLDELLAFRKKLNIPFRLHPLGFISSTLLCEGQYKVRLHLWSGAGGVQQSSECLIHDHCFEFKSWVMAGAVENVEYALSETGVEYALYETEYKENQSILVKTQDTHRVIESKRTKYMAGASYSMCAGVLHETVRIAGAPTVTVLLTKDVSTSAPLVLGPINGDRKYVYRREVMEENTLQRILEVEGFLRAT